MKKLGEILFGLPEGTIPDQPITPESVRRQAEVAAGMARICRVLADTVAPMSVNERRVLDEWEKESLAAAAAPMPKAQA